MKLMDEYLQLYPKCLEPNAHQDLKSLILSSDNIDLINFEKMWSYIKYFTCISHLCLKCSNEADKY